MQHTQKDWPLIKHRDEYAGSQEIKDDTASVVSGLKVEDLKKKAVKKLHQLEIQENSKARRQFRCGGKAISDAGNSDYKTFLRPSSGSLSPNWMDIAF